jgi:hypothetical protein
MIDNIRDCGKHCQANELLVDLKALRSLLGTAV